jgi:signal transduction histidine kinase
MMSAELELQLHRFLSRLWTKLKPSRETEHAARAAARDTSAFFGAQAACLSRVPPGANEAEITFSLPAGTEWDTDLLASFFRNERPAIPADWQLAPIERHGRLWRVLALRFDGGPPSRERRAALSQVAAAIAEILQQIDHERMREIRSRIEHKMMEELRPKDLFYQILHGLRTLTGYDHSSALLVPAEDRESLVLVAEQIAWTKAKSAKIGLKIPLDGEVHRLLERRRTYGFERDDGSWRDWSGSGAEPLADRLDYNRDDPQRPRERAMLCAPVIAGEGVMGVLKVSSIHAGTFGRYEADLLERFLPPVAVAIQNSRRAETLHARMLDAEQKNAMADLARSVAHDVNNALGSVAPLVQQLRADARRGRIDPQVLAADLDEIDRSIQVCTRIFGGMLAFARGTQRRSGSGSVPKAIGATLAMLEAGLRRRGIECKVDSAPDLPPVPADPSRLEQLFFNLLANARDAMPEGGRIDITVRRLDGAERAIAIEIADTGGGIPEENLALIQQPFFSTKPQGKGLGLAICRSIVWSMQGRLEIESRAGRGTTVRLVLPAAGGEEPR